MKMQSKGLLQATRLLTIVAMVLIGFAYVSPIWWVSLKAPNYPPETFPDGIRIHFHVNGVFNGCKARPETSEVDEEEPLDCVHEMNTINHFIGMHPIEEGARLEQKAAPYLFGLLEVMLATFLFYSGRFWWVLPSAGIIVPVAFVIDYSAWLWWFGHTLRPWGAFTIKPFMPTVFGQGKVAQFTTYSYPHYGFGLLVAAAACLILAALLRRKQLRGG
ncbi:MAG: hypothetical protein M0006_01220 [Magnetospirillum sp.]|nr:hypothetical protein [Magnetospirillum sp.]